MYYDINSNQLLNDCPLDGYLLVENSNGDKKLVLVQGLDLADFETKKTCGILPVKSDYPNQPENSFEDISQREIVIEDDGVIIKRVYVSNPVVVPQNISARQVRLWLIENNINLSAVETAINSIVDEKIREKTRVEWEFAPYVERNHPLIESIGNILGLDSDQIDQGFIVASQL